MFSRVGDKFMVRAHGPDGALHDYEISYTFGIDPLQHSDWIPIDAIRCSGSPGTPARRTRVASVGLTCIPTKSSARLAVHWTGRDQTWNYQCADCHTTDLKKNFDLSANTYATTWANLGVTCEVLPWPRISPCGLGEDKPEPDFGRQLRPSR